jgi:hypothetical protein
MMLAENFQIADQYLHKIIVNAHEEKKFTRMRREIRYNRMKSVFMKTKTELK